MVPLNLALLPENGSLCGSAGSAACSVDMLTSSQHVFHGGLAPTLGAGPHVPMARCLSFPEWQRWAAFELNASLTSLSAPES